MALNTSRELSYQAPKKPNLARLRKRRKSNVEPQKSRVKESVEVILSQKELFRTSYLEQPRGFQFQGDIEAWKHQQEGEDALRELLTEGKDSGYYSIGTAGGKTNMYTEVLGKAKGRKLVLVPSLEAYTRAVDGINTIKENGAGDLKVCYFREDISKEEALAADIVLVSWQKLIRSNKDQGRLYTFFPKDHFGGLIVDEAHHFLGANNHKIITYFDAIKLGYTATPRNGGKHIASLFEHELLTVPITELIEKGFCPQVQAFRYMVSGETLSSVPTKGKSGDYREKEKLAALNIEERLSIMEEIIVDIFNNSEETLMAYVSSRTTGQQLYDKLITKHGEHFPIAYVDSTTKNRTAILEDFEGKNIRGLISVHVLDESKSTDHVSNLVMGDPTQSERIYVQRLGRGARLDAENPDKILKVHDLVSCIETLAARQHITAHGYFGAEKYTPHELLLSKNGSPEKTSTTKEDKKVQEIEYERIPLNERIMFMDTAFMRDKNIVQEIARVFCSLAQISTDAFQVYLNTGKPQTSWKNTMLTIRHAGNKVTLDMLEFYELIYIYKKQKELIRSLGKCKYDLNSAELPNESHTSQLKVFHSKEEAQEYIDTHSRIENINFHLISERSLFINASEKKIFKNCVFRGNTLFLHNKNKEDQSKSTIFDSCSFQHSTIRPVDPNDSGLYHTVFRRFIDCNDSVIRTQFVLEKLKENETGFFSFNNSQWSSIFFLFQDPKGISDRASQKTHAPLELQNCTHMGMKVRNTYPNGKPSKENVAAFKAWRSTINSTNLPSQLNFSMSTITKRGNFSFEVKSPEHTENQHYELHIIEEQLRPFMQIQAINSPAKTVKRQEIFKVAKYIFGDTTIENLKHRRILTFANPNILPSSNGNGTHKTALQEREYQTERMLVEFNEIWGPLGFKREDLIFIEHTDAVAQKIKELLPESTVIQGNAFNKGIAESIQGVLKSREQLAAIFLDPFDSYTKAYGDTVTNILDAKVLNPEKSVFATNFYASRLGEYRVQKERLRFLEKVKEFIGGEPEYNGFVNSHLYNLSETEHLSKEQVGLGNIATLEINASLLKNRYLVSHFTRGAYCGTENQSKMLYDIFGIENKEKHIKNLNSEESWKYFLTKAEESIMERKILSPTNSVTTAAHE